MYAEIDLSEFPVIDAHCHSYLKTPKVLTGDEFARYASLAVQPNFLDNSSAIVERQVKTAHRRLSDIYRQQPFLGQLVAFLSRFFDCQADLETVTKNRSARAEDFDNYVKELFEDVRLRGLVMDGGYPTTTIEEMKRFPASVVRIFRIEPFIDEVLSGASSFDEVCAMYESGICNAVKNEGYVGLKSIIAYRTGLKIRRVSWQDAGKDFDDAKSSHTETAWFGPRVKNLRDFLFVRAMELSTALGIPMQVHTGVGDYDILLDQCDPALLYDLLKDEKLRYATVVLVHSGFPHCQVAAYITSVLPNVFLDLSLTIPFLNPLGHERLTEILEIAPSSKIMYGSDAFNLPELIWLGAKVGKRTLGKCLSRFVQSELFDENRAMRVGMQILFENANELYGLGLD